MTASVCVHTLSGAERRGDNCRKLYMHLLRFAIGPSDLSLLHMRGVPCAATMAIPCSCQQMSVPIVHVLEHGSDVSQGTVDRDTFSCLSTFVN